MIESLESVLFSWSGGKDSAMALHEVLNCGKYKVEALLTVVSSEHDRISMHGVRNILLERQADSLGLPLEKIYISSGASNEEYEYNMHKVLEKYLLRGVTKVVFGDIFLEDLKKYREEKLKSVNMTAVFPLWGRNTTEIVSSFIQSGFKAVVTCVDTKVLDKDFAGRIIDEKFVSEYPSNADVCGENGEYHSFVYAGPIFSEEVSFLFGEKAERENGFFFCDLFPD